MPGKYKLVLTLAILAISASCTKKESAPVAKAPSRIEKIPADLTDKLLDLSGIYPDGWTAPKASLTLSEPDGKHLLVIHGMIPKVDKDDFHCDVEVKLDDKTLLKKSVGLGDFSIESNVPPEPGQHRIDLIFSPVQILPGGDGRVIGTRLSLAAFESGAPAQGGDIVERGSGVRLGNGWRATETLKNETSRKAGADAQLLVESMQAGTKKVILDAEFGGESGKPELLRVLDTSGRQVDAVEVGHRGLVQLYLPVEAGQDNDFRLHLSSSPGAGDSGLRVYRISAY